MRSMKFFLLAVVLVIGAGIAFAATIQTSTVQVTGLPNVYVTSQGPSGSTVVVSSAPKGGANKKAMIHKVTIGGTDRLYLVRIENTSRGIFVDLVSDATITSLSTTAASLNLTTPSHPSPTKDSADTEALVAAGGS